MLASDSDKDFFSFEAVHDIQSQHAVWTFAVSIGDNFQPCDETFASNIANPLRIFSLEIVQEVAQQFADIARARH